MPKSLEEIVDKCTIKYKQEQSKRFCECAINLMVGDMTIEEVIAYLEAQIDILKQYEK